jgi:Arc/MetJ-type ribon-helix-helix transcriptional regulator
MAMTITLSPEVESYILRKVADGTYPDVDTVVLDALDALADAQALKSKRGGGAFNHEDNTVHADLIALMAKSE